MNTFLNWIVVSVVRTIAVVVGFAVLELFVIENVSEALGFALLIAEVAFFARAEKANAAVNAR